MRPSREIARVHAGEFRLTCNQNLIVAGVPADQRKRIDALVRPSWTTGEKVAAGAVAVGVLAAILSAGRDDDRRGGDRAHHGRDASRPLRR